MLLRIHQSFWEWLEQTGEFSVADLATTHFAVLFHVLFSDPFACRFESFGIRFCPDRLLAREAKELILCERYFPIRTHRFDEVVEYLAVEQ